MVAIQQQIRLAGTHAAQSAGSIIGAIEPDPCRPAFPQLYLRSAQGAVGKRWLAQQERRAAILAAARQLMGEIGFDAVCFRRIADICGISTQTIYNIVGDRAEVMNAAAAEWVYWLALSASPPPGGGSRAIEVLESFWVGALDHCAFSASAARICVNTPQAPIARAFSTATRNIILNLLGELRALNQLRPSVNLDLLANQLNISMRGAICNWLLDPYDKGTFFREFAHGPGLMLLGAVSGGEVARVEQRLDAISSGYRC